VQSLTAKNSIVAEAEAILDRALAPMAVA